MWLLSSLMILATKWKPHWYLWASRCCVYSDLQGFSCGIPHENPQHHTRHFRPEFISFIMANVLFLVQKYKKVWSNLHFFSWVKSSFKCLLTFVHKLQTVSTFVLHFKRRLLLVVEKNRAEKFCSPNRFKLSAPDLQNFIRWPKV